MKRWFACITLLAASAGLLAAQTAQPNMPDGKKYTASVHLKSGMQCTDCHGEGAKRPVSRTKCQECHGSYQDLAKRTADVEPNPHYNHTIDLDCNACHHMHKPAEVYCQNCHKQLQFTRQAAAAKEAAREGK